LKRVIVILQGGTPDWIELCDCRLTARQLRDLRIRQEKERIRREDMHREANERLEEVIAQMAREKHDNAIARFNAEFLQRLESRANDRDRLMCSVG